MDVLVVVERSNCIFCSEGTSTSVLVVTSCNTPPVNGSLAATIQDHVSHDNVKPFGKCKITGRHCDPKTPQPWMPGAKDVLTGETSDPYPTLTENSFLNCEEGGIVQIATAGQSFFKIGSDYELLYGEDGRLIGYAHLHDDAVTSAYDTDGGIVYEASVEGDDIFIDIALTIAGGRAIKLVGERVAGQLAKRAEGKLAAAVWAVRIRRAKGVQRNALRGERRELQVARELQREGHTLLGPGQVTVKTPLTNRRVDFLIRDGRTGQIRAIEVKSGGAKRTRSQIDKDEAMESSGGRIIGKNAPPGLRGKRVRIPTEVRH